MTACDVVVVGGGAMGSAAAWWLAREGRRVVLLERFEAGHVRGSSHGGSRIFRLAYPEPRYVRMAQRAVRLWRELEHDSGTPLLQLTGSVDHGDAAAVESIAKALDACDGNWEVLSADAASRHWPGLRFDGNVLHQPEGGRVLADGTVAALHRRAAAHGADLHFEEAALALAAEDAGVVVDTEAGRYRAPVAVVAAGSWTGKLLGGIVPLPPLTVTQEQVFHFPSREPATPWPSFIHHRQPFVYGLETPGEGVKVAEHHTGPVVDPDRRDFAVDPAGADRVRTYVEQCLPGLDPEPVSATTCLYTTTPTEDFVIERHGPLVVAAGFSGHGFKFTPLVGRLLADLALREP